MQKRARRRRGTFTRAGAVTITLADGSTVVRPPYNPDQLDAVRRDRRHRNVRMDPRNILPIELQRFDGRLRHLSWADRATIWERDGGHCRYCTTDTGPWEFDHVTAFSRGGPTTVGNIVLACRDCNQRRGTATWRPRPLDMHRDRIRAGHGEPRTAAHSAGDRSSPALSSTDPA